MPLDPARTVADLKQLRELTGDADGAQRVAWTATWEEARAFLRGLLEGTGATEEIDAAGNQWFTLPGDSERVLIIGGHMDSVPNGGWLDGCGRLDARPGRAAVVDRPRRDRAARCAARARRRPRRGARRAVAARRR